MLLLAIGHARNFASDSTAIQQIRRIRLTVSALLTLLSSESTNLDHSHAHLIGLLLFSLAAAMLFLKYPSSQKALHSSDPHKSSASALHALSKVLIPTCSIWPKSYTDLARSASDGTEIRHISLSLNVVFRDIKQGRVELRSPTTDLSLLIKGELAMDGWNIDLDLSLNDRIKTLKWLLSDELTFFPDELFPRPGTFSAGGNMPVAERAVMMNYCMQYATHGADYMRATTHPIEINAGPLSCSLLSHVIVWPSLDTIPRALTETFVRFTQNLLSVKCTNRNMSTLSFTTAEAIFSPFDKSFVLAALPFSRANTKDAKFANSGSSHSRLRTPAPLFTRLPRVLALLTSGPHALHILALSNASAAYARALDVHAAALEYDDAVRRDYIKIEGVQRWREERLYARWEAALLRGGIVTRWVVILGRKE